MPSGIYKHKKGYKRLPYSKEWKYNMSVAKKKNPTRYWLGKKRPEIKEFFTMKGKYHSEETKNKMMGRKVWNKGLKEFLAREESPHWKGGLPKCSCGATLSDYGKRNCWGCYLKLNSHRGEKNVNWKGGISKINKTERQLAMETIEYKLWRINIFQRDNYKCRMNNQDCRGRLEAHHILGWKDYPELRYDINNGITLCHFHHPKKRKDEVNLSPYFQKLVMNI